LFGIPSANDYNLLSAVNIIIDCRIYLRNEYENACEPVWLGRQIMWIWFKN